jgi:hypothetical protein
MISSDKLLANSISFIYYIHYIFYQKILTWRNKCPPPIHTQKPVNCVTTSKQGATNNEISNWSLYQRNTVSTVQHLSEKPAMYPVISWSTASKLV